MMRLLCQSALYEVASEWEYAYLDGSGQGHELLVAYFEGDPRAAAIDPDERWLVVAGQGLVVYRLEPPWHPFDATIEDQQWWAWHLDGKGPTFSSIVHVEDDLFRCDPIADGPAFVVRADTRGSVTPVPS